LVPTISVSNLAKVSPEPGTAVDFTEPQTYTVTAEDGSTQDYLVTVKAIPNPSLKAIKSFALKTKAGEPAGSTVTVSGDTNTIVFKALWGTNVEWLIPTILFDGASVSPKSDLAQNFSEPVQYIVTAKDGSTREYLVAVTVTQANEKAITRFVLKTKDGTDVGILVEATEAVPVPDTIAISVPWGTDFEWLVPTIKIYGASVSPATAVTQDFSTPVRYTVTAQDGSTKEYLVTVTITQATDNAITKFALKTKDGTDAGTPAEATEAVPVPDTIAISVPWGTDVEWLVPTIGKTGVSVSPATGVAQDFSSPVRYTVTAQNGSTHEYLVTVTVTQATDNAITSFALKAKDGTDAGSATTPITGDAITISVPWGTDVKWLVPTIGKTGVSVSPATGVAQDFSSPVRYTVTAQNGSTHEYLVTVTKASLTSLTVTPPIKPSYALNEPLDLAGLAVTATYSDGDTETVKAGDGGYTTSGFNSSTIGTKTITVSLTRNGKTMNTTFPVTVTGEPLALKIELVNDKIVSLFGITEDELADTAKGIQLSVKGLRREVVISLTGYSTNPTSSPSSDVSWKIDNGAWSTGVSNGSANIVRIVAANYTLGRHWVEFRGTKDDGSGTGNMIPYSKTFYFTVDID
jgi:hypothetical protein